MHRYRSRSDTTQLFDVLCEWELVLHIQGAPDSRMSCGSARIARTHIETACAFSFANIGIGIAQSNNIQSASPHQDNRHITGFVPLHGGAAAHSECHHVMPAWIMCMDHL